MKGHMRGVLALAGCLLLMAAGLYHSSQPAGVRKRPQTLDSKLPFPLCLVDLGEGGREGDGEGAPNLRATGGEEKDLLKVLSFVCTGIPGRAPWPKSRACRGDCSDQAHDAAGGEGQGD